MNQNGPFSFTFGFVQLCLGRKSLLTAQTDAKKKKNQKTPKLLLSCGESTAEGRKPITHT